MRYNRTRHKALLLLSEKFNKLLNEKTGSVGGNEVGLSNEELNSLLNIDDRKRRLVFSELFENEEVMPYHLDGISGCFIHSEKGLESLANEKYLERNREIVKNWIKDLVQIAIPVLSLIITILVIIRDDAKRDNEMQDIEQKVEELQGNIKLMELRNKTLHNYKINDSISNGQE
jgi:hypothetical protein